MGSELMLTTVVTILLAFIGYIVTYLNNLRLSQRAERLERVNRQLGELYGPMFALTNAGDTIWRAFRSVYRPEYKAYFGEGDPPTDEELAAWRLWMSTVFMPINSRLYELILSKMDLLIEKEIPPVILDFFAHVAAYQVVLEQWRNGDFSEHVSLINYPSSISDYAYNSFKALKDEQEKLLGIKKKKHI